MKNFKKIIALITSVMMLSSVSAFAEPEDGADVVSIDANTAVAYILTSTVGDTVAPGDSFDVAVKVGSKDSADYIGIGALSFDIEYNTSLFDVAVSSSQPTSNSATRIEGADEENYFWMAKANSSNINSGVIHTAKVSQNAGKALAGYFNNSDMHYVSTENAFLTFTFTVKADAVATQDVTLSLIGCEALSTDSTIMNKNGAVTGSYTFDIAVAGGDVDEIKATQTAGTNNDSYEFSNVADDSKLKGQKVALRKTSVAGTAITENTRVKVTAAGRSQIYGGDMWAKLNAEGDGTLAAKNVTFGIIFSDASLTADSFTFEIIEQ